MVSLTTGRSKPCKDSLAGFDVVYLFPFVKYNRSQIVIDGHTLTTFPATTIYKYYIVNPSFTETQTEEGGGKFYNQNLSFDLAREDIVTDNQIIRLLKKDYRAIVLDRNGNYRILGLYNGLISDLSKTTGDARADFNGYKLSMQGQEILSSLFITDLEDAGFVISDDGYLLLEDGFYLLLEDNNRIILE